jgi:hypothetical protein
MGQQIYSAISGLTRPAKLQSYSFRFSTVKFFLPDRGCKLFTLQIKLSLVPTLLEVAQATVMQITQALSTDHQKTSGYGENA